jgi:ureidoacrylate peracid hydrolase
VESTLRDAYFHEYWPLLVTDGALQAGPPEAHTATVFNVESFFGWTIGTCSLIEALGRSLSASSQSPMGLAAASDLLSSGP